MTRLRVTGLVALVVVVLGLLSLRATQPDVDLGRPAVSPTRSDAPTLTTETTASTATVPRVTVVEEAAIVDYGKVIYRGPVDLTATIARIKAGERHRHGNDGAVFNNRERRLPRRPRGYYHEYVHPTIGLNGPGPQRIVVGQDGDWYYTPDHYATFVPLR